MAELTLPGYELIKKIASGGMGAIWSAYSPAGALRAVKVIHPGLADDPSFSAMLLREAMVMAQLEHENICRFYTFGKTPTGEMYLEMEFIDGITLRALVEHGNERGIPLPFWLCSRLTQGLCAGLGYAHEQVGGLIHRDISPQNAMITREGAIKILDFGVAKLTRQLGQTQPGTIKGKASYMSPEQLCGQDLDHRSDIFSMGIVLWELLTGERLFKAANAGGAAATMFMVLEGQHAPYRSPSSVRSDTPAALEHIAMKALSFHRNDRYQDCMAMWHDLEAWCRQQNAPADVQPYLEQEIFGVRRDETMVDLRRNTAPAPYAGTYTDSQPSPHFQYEKSSPSVLYEPEPSAIMELGADALITEDELESELAPATQVAPTRDISGERLAPLPRTRPMMPQLATLPQRPQPKPTTQHTPMPKPSPKAKPPTATAGPTIPQYTSTIRQAPKRPEPTSWLWGIGFLAICAAASIGAIWLYQSSRQPANTGKLGTTFSKQPQLALPSTPRAPTRIVTLPQASPEPAAQDAGATAAQPLTDVPDDPPIDEGNVQPRYKARRRRRRRRRRRTRRRRRRKRTTPRPQPTPRKRQPPDKRSVTPPPPRRKGRCSADAKWLRIRPLKAQTSLNGLRIALGRVNFRFPGSRASFCILRSVKRITISPADPKQRKRFWPCSVPIHGKQWIYFSLADITGMPSKRCFRAK